MIEFLELVPTDSNAQVQYDIDTPSSFSFEYFIMHNCTTSKLVKRLWVFLHFLACFTNSRAWHPAKNLDAIRFTI